jgi:enhancing lycopene biosynthesis protein 2
LVEEAIMRIGVLISGCGVYDGAEIQETVLTLLALDRRGVEALVCAPDMPQLHVIDHRKGRPDPGASRNVLVEAARIARGEIRELAGVSANEIDALVLPGGFGAAKNLSDFASRGEGCTVHPDVARLVRDVHASGKPIGALCIAPALLARVLGDEHPRLTIGCDPATAAALSAMGAVHVECEVQGVVIDLEHRLVTGPAYMVGERISEVADGVERVVGEIVTMARSSPVRRTLATASV